MGLLNGELGGKTTDVAVKFEASAVLPCVVDIQRGLAGAMSAKSRTFMGSPIASCRRVSEEGV